MSTTTTYGYKRPQVGDRSTWWTDLTDNIDRLDAHDHDGVDSPKIAGSNVLNTAAGNLAATNVQSALNELQGDIDTINTSLSGLSTLADGKIYVGNGSNVATEVTMSGDVTITNAGVAAISSGVIVNDDVNASAAIAYSKLNLATSIVNADVAVGAAIAYSKLNLATSIVNADVAVAAAIARSKLASGTADHVLINDGSGVMSSEATLSKARGGAGADMSSVTFPSSGTIATIAGTQQLTNKDYDGGTASNSLRLTVPKNTYANLAALTRKQGTIVYATDQSKLYADDGSTLRAIGSGGGSGSIEWFGDDGQQPFMLAANGDKTYQFEDGLTQYLYFTYKVPSGYIAGTQINLKISYFTASTSNTVLFTSVSTLIRSGTDAITSTTNQYTSTNAAVTNSGSANKLNSQTLDITSSTGTINSVAVSAGDIIRVRLTRDTGTDTDTATVSMLPVASEVL